MQADSRHQASMLSRYRPLPPFLSNFNVPQESDHLNAWPRSADEMQTETAVRPLGKGTNVHR